MLEIFIVDDVRFLPNIKQVLNVKQNILIHTPLQLPTDSLFLHRGQPAVDMTGNDKIRQTTNVANVNSAEACSNIVIYIYICKWVMTECT